MMQFMHILIPLMLVLAIVFVPGLWVRRVMTRYSNPGDRYAGTGGQLARHLLDRFGLQDVQVEETDKGDHYDPQDKAVRLAPGNLQGHSLTAVTVSQSSL